RWPGPVGRPRRTRGDEESLAMMAVVMERERLVKAQDKPLMDEVVSEAVLDQAYACPGPDPGAAVPFRSTPTSGPSAAPGRMNSRGCGAAGGHLEWPKNSNLAFQKRLQRRDDVVYLPPQWVCAPLVSLHELRNSTRLCISSAVRDAIRRSRRRMYSPTEYCCCRARTIPVCALCCARELVWRR